MVSHYAWNHCVTIFCYNLDKNEICYENQKIFDIILFENQNYFKSNTKYLDNLSNVLSELTYSINLLTVFI